MRLTPWEEERLRIFTAAELARRHRSAGLKLNHPEAVALIRDAMLEAAWGGARYDEFDAAGRSAVRQDEVLEGVRELPAEVRLEILLGDGSASLEYSEPTRYRAHRGGSGTASAANAVAFVSQASLDGRLAVEPVTEVPLGRRYFLR